MERKFIFNFSSRNCANEARAIDRARKRDSLRWPLIKLKNRKYALSHQLESHYYIKKQFKIKRKINCHFMKPENVMSQENMILYPITAIVITQPDLSLSSASISFPGRKVVLNFSQPTYGTRDIVLMSHWSKNTTIVSTTLNVDFSKECFKFWIQIDVILRNKRYP